jgi:hypothetical protein
VAIIMMGLVNLLLLEGPLLLVLLRAADHLAA